MISIIVISQRAMWAPGLSTVNNTQRDAFRSEVAQRALLLFMYKLLCSLGEHEINKFCKLE